MIKLYQFNHFKNHLSSFLSQLWALAELATWALVSLQNNLKAAVCLN